MKETDVAIIGGGPGGRVVVHALHRSGRGLRVSLFKDEPTNVNRCAVPYGVDGVRPIEDYQISNRLVTDYGAELVVAEVAAIDPAAGTLRLSDGLEYRYRHLVLATGARPVLPPIEGVESRSVLPVRSLTDLDQLRRRAASARMKRAVVVGGGYIGVEMSVVLRKMGFRVSLVEMLPRILMQTTEPEFGERIARILGDEGIESHTDVRVDSIREMRDSGLEVRLANGTTLEGDFAVLATGVRLNTALAEAAGIETSPFGIRVDGTLRTNFENVFAAGDCAAKSSLVTGRPIRGEFGTNAVFMGKVVAQNILGGRALFPGVINTNVTKAFEWGVGSAGVTEAAARDAGLEVITGQSRVLDKYPMMEGGHRIHTKLVFERGSERLLGGTVMQRGEGVAGNVDFLSLAIQMRATLDDLRIHQYATHPELAAKPSDNRFVLAAEDAERARESIAIA